MSDFRSSSEVHLSSPVFPGGNLLSAYFDRDVVRLSDRGGASGLIGDRWSDICADILQTWPGRRLDIRGDGEIEVERIVRLDDLPAVARAASRKKMQNPDFIVVGEGTGGPLTFAADAKFSVETAGASQVSREALEALLEIGPVMSQAVGDLHKDVSVADGIFLSPDYGLTHYMLGRKRGYRSVSVPHEQVTLLPVTALGFLKPVEGANLIPIFARADNHDRQSRQNLLLALYYFRLGRAGIGLWNDETASLLMPKHRADLDLRTIAVTASELAGTATSAWEIIEQWDRRAEAARAQRQQVADATSLPIVNRELREKVEAAAAQAGAPAPSLNKVRRRIGSWFNDRLIEDFGLLMPPVPNFPEVVRLLRARADELRPEIDRVTAQMIQELLEEPPAAG